MTVEKAVLNRYLFTQLNLDSGALTMLGTVIHNFAEPGRYRINVWRGESLAGSLHLTVDPECPATQVTIDLAAVDGQDQPRCGDSGTALAVNPKGYAVFHVGTGAGGYAVTAGRIDRDQSDKVFDSRELQAGDMFAATILRPGTYGVVNLRTKARAQLTVAYPKVGKERYVPQDPLSIECTKDGFRPNAIKVNAAQSQVFRIATLSRLRIDLLKADDGPHGGQPPRPGWRKPVLETREPPLRGRQASGAPQQAQAGKKAGGKAN